MTAESADRSDQVRERARFLSRIDPFRGLGPEELDRVAASVVERLVLSGEAVLVEYGVPGTQLYVVKDGTLELVHNRVPIDVISAGEVFGHPTLLTGLPPEFTTRAREASSLYCIPMDIALEILSRLEGVRFVARTLRERLTHAANQMALPDVRTRPVTALLRGAPLFCGPDVSIREAASLMIAGGRSAILVQARGGLGIVTDVDLRDKVVAPGESGGAAVSSIMSVPVKTIGADVLAAEAAIAMMEAGVNHMPVVDAGGQVLGILSAGSLMSLETLSPFALRRSLLSARTVDDVTAAAADVPKLFIDLMAAANLDAAVVTRIITLLSDAATSRLLELAFERYGGPPADYAWLAFGSTARSELTLASDQDNGLAYADTDDPTADEYFRRVAEQVNEGLRLCGFQLDTHGVLAQNDEWRMAASAWVDVFKRCLGGSDNDRLLRAAVAFDFRQVSGSLPIVPQLADLIRETPRHARFKAGLADLGSEIRSPLGFRQRLVGPIDIKKSGLLPIQNMARYYAFSGGITAPTTLERLVAVEERGSAGSESASALREAFVGMSLLRLRHHAKGLRAGRAPDDAIDTTDLRPLTRVTLREALRVVAAEQQRLPQRPA